MNTVFKSSSGTASRQTMLLAIFMALAALGFLVIPAHKALAADIVSTAVYQDLNNDGYIDNIRWTMDENVTACPFVSGNWSIPQAGTVSINSVTGLTCSGTTTLDIAVTSNAATPTTGGATNPTLTYTHADGADITLTSGSMGTHTAQSATDDAAPVVTSVQFWRNGSSGDYYENMIIFYYSENMSASISGASIASLGDITTAGTVAGLGSFAAPGDVTVASGHNTVQSYGNILLFAAAKYPYDTRWYLDPTSTTAPSGLFTPLPSAALTESFASHKEINAAHAVMPSVSVTWDVGKPRISSVTLADARNGNGLIDRATIVFTKQILDSSITSADATLGGQRGSFTTGGADDGDTITFNVRTDNLAMPATEVQLLYSGATTKIFDRAGNLLDAAIPGTIAAGDIIETIAVAPPAGRYNYNHPPAYIGQIFNSPAGAVNAGFYRPQAFTVGPDGLYYSVANGNQMGQKFNANGEILAVFGSRGTYEGQFESPDGIAVNASGDFYVVDSYNNRVQKFDANGNFLAKWGSSGSGDGQFNQPKAVAVDGSGNVYVADTSNNRVQKFDANGNFLAKWGSFGTSNGQFNNPRGIAFDAAGDIYVADCNNNRIQKFDANGNFLAKWGSSGSGDGQLNGASSIAVNSRGESFVVDQNNSRIVKFDANGTFVMSWGSQGHANGQFAAFGSTTSISVDAQDRVYVVDTYNGRIQIFDADGRYVGQVGSGGNASGQFAGVGGVALDAAGNIYAVDVYNHRVQKFDANGNFILAFGGYGSGDGQMEYPTGIAINTSGDVYVTEQGNQRVDKFDANGNFLAKWGGYGSGNGQFNNPVQINLDAAGNVYVGDSNNYRIQKFDANGNFIAKYGTIGTGNGQFAGGVDGVAFDSQGNMYTSEYYLCRIQKFDHNGNFLAKWGTRGDADGQFNEPIQIAIGPHDLIYVVEALNDRIQVFDSNGNFLGKWGGYGNAAGQFIYPMGIAINGQGKIIVGDSNNKIQMFEYVGGPFAPSPWTLALATDAASYIRSNTVNFSVTTSMQRTNPLTNDANQMQVVLDTGVKVPLIYSSTNGSGDTVWIGSYTIPEDTAYGVHNYTVQANAAMVKTDIATAFSSPATGSENTGLIAAGSFDVIMHHAPAGLTGTGSITQIPTITVTAPVSGASYKADAVLGLEWTPANGVFTKYKVSYSADNGATWTSISDNATTPILSWTVPDAGTTHGKIKVEGYDASGTLLATGLSGGDFTIIGDTVPEAAESSGTPPTADPTVSGAYTSSEALENTPDINTDKGLKAKNQEPDSASAPPGAPNSNPPCVSGSLIKGTPSAVYYCGEDGKRYVFVNERVYFTWYFDFAQVKVISDADLAQIPIGGNITYRPGAKLVKAQTNPKVYAVARGGILRWLETEAVAARLYGSDWNKHIDYIPDAFFVNYTIGDPIAE